MLIDALFSVDVKLFLLRILPPLISDLLASLPIEMDTSFLLVIFLPRVFKI
jgi:hypothetical protein